MQNNSDKFDVKIQKFQASEREKFANTCDFLVDLENYFYVSVSFEAFFILCITHKADGKTIKIGLTSSDHHDIEKSSYVQDDDTLIALCDSIVLLIDLYSGKILNKNELCDITNGWGLFAFDDGYLVHTEQTIFKLNKKAEVVWEFWGPDIWATPNGMDEAFKIDGERILLEDFGGNTFVVDKNGKQIEYKPSNKNFAGFEGRS